MATTLSLKTKAPEFIAKDVFGNPVSLGKVTSQYVLVVFLRYSGCPYCNLAVHRLSVEYASLKKNNCEVIAFVQSSKENIVSNIYDRHAKKPPFSIVPDPEKNIYKKYGVTSSIVETVKEIKRAPYWVQAAFKHGYKQSKIDGRAFLVPAWFLINTETNRIVRKEEGVSFYSTDTFIEIYDVLLFKD